MVLVGGLHSFQFHFVTAFRFATLPSTTLHFHSFHHLFCTAQQEYSLIPYCKTNPLLSVSWLLLCLRYNVFCVEIIYKKRYHTQAKATSHSKHLRTFCNIPFSHTLAFSLRYQSVVCFIFSATYSPNPKH